MEAISGKENGNRRMKSRTPLQEQSLLDGEVLRCMRFLLGSASHIPAESIQTEGSETAKRAPALSCSGLRSVRRGRPGRNEPADVRNCSRNRAVEDPRITRQSAGEALPLLCFRGSLPWLRWRRRGWIRLLLGRGNWDSDRWRYRAGLSGSGSCWNPDGRGNCSGPGAAGRRGGDRLSSLRRRPVQRTRGRFG